MRESYRKKAKETLSLHLPKHLVPHPAPSYRSLEKASDLTAFVEGLTIRAEKPVGTQKGIHFRSLNLEGVLRDWS